MTSKNHTPIDAQGIRKQYEGLHRDYMKKINLINDSKKKFMSQMKEVSTDLEQEEETYIDLIKKKGETQNEVFTLQDLCKNDKDLRKQLNKANDEYKTQLIDGIDVYSKGRDDMNTKLISLEKEIDKLK